MTFLDHALTAAIRRDIDTVNDLAYCDECRWLYYAHDMSAGLCGTCRREAGMEPSDALTRELDARVRAYQRDVSER